MNKSDELMMSPSELDAHYLKKIGDNGKLPQGHIPQDVLKRLKKKNKIKVKSEMGAGTARAGTTWASVNE
tara:strand:- start:1013 stop:1222 length:210 start_codon:yes stop_codon:yes gene_type:complete